MNQLSYSNVRVFIFLATVASVWSLAFAEDSTLPCDVSVPCDCCLDGLCHNGSNVCSGEFCKDGYWSGTCTKRCPEECVSCHRNFIVEQLCFECLSGHYGSKCGKNCSVGCNNDSCDKDSGDCMECNNGFYGAKWCNASCSEHCKGTTCDINDGACSECIEGMHGKYCNLTCPVKCTDEICIQESGHCISCKPGYFGEVCEDMCPEHCLSNFCYMTAGNCLACADGYHGLNCSESCPVTCNNCDIYDGMCTTGCVPNFTGDFCESCVPGKYGVDCDGSCSLNCANITCNRYNGTCIGGCKDGYSDSHFCCANNSNCGRCSSYTSCTHCNHGTYGTLCEGNCSEYCQNGCDKISGHCFKCDLNRYGPLCEYICPKHCASQDNVTQACHMNGACKLGCTNGYYGQKCDKECSPACNRICDRDDGECDSCVGNAFGEYCEKNCSTNCIHLSEHSSCFKSNGTCIGGCKENYFGDTCKKACLKSCNGSCHRESGECHRCVFNYFGHYCDNNCSDNCEHGYSNMTTCHQYNGTCNFGCVHGYVGQSCSDIVTGEDDEFPVGAVVGSMVVCVAVVAVVVAVVIFVVKKRARQRKSDRQSDRQRLEPKYENAVYDGAHHSEEEELDEGAHVPTAKSLEENPYYSNEKRLKTKLSKINLREMLSKSDEEYKQEFEFLPTGLIRPYTEATKSENAHKNRYKRIYPYDQSRVKVPGTDSDYINASYIHGYKKKRAYIAAQGPTTKNLGADFAMFWKMVWQEKVETVVMVTKLHEISGSKCDQYWPNVDTASTYAEFAVYCAKEEVFTEFVVRSFTITKGYEKRHLNHVNFTAWPDKGVPNDVISIINLRHKVDKMRKMFDGPLLVHCSAGIGRTGTYIALDILTRQGYDEDHIDVFECVVDMRQHRPSMVQTQEQYQFLYHAVVWTLTADIAPLPADSFVDLHWLDGIKRTEIFKQLQLSNFYDNAEEMTAVNDNKRIAFSNRKGADIPGRRHGVSLVKNEMANKSSYINAVYLDSYKTKDRFIAAMTPLPETVTDFMGMLLQEEVTCIVDLTPSDSDQEDIGEYLPADNQTVEYESHVFTISAREARDCFVKREIELSNKSKNKGGDRRTIHHYQFTRWAAGSKLPSSADFVTLVNAVDTATIKMQLTGPIVVHCLTGAVRSGLFCAVWLLIERMQIDNEVSVLNTLRQVKTRRRGAIPDKEQIAFCFECVDHHLRYLSERVYSSTELKPGW